MGLGPNIETTVFADMPKYGNNSTNSKKPKVYNIIRQPSEPVVRGYYEAIPRVKMLVISKVQNSPISDTRSSTNAPFHHLA